MSTSMRRTTLDQQDSGSDCPGNGCRLQSTRIANGSKKRRARPDAPPPRGPRRK
jgi:hypothetical protein